MPGNKSARDLAERVVRHGDDGSLQNIRVRVQHIVDLDGGNSLAADGNEIDEPVANLDASLVVPARDVAGPIPVVDRCLFRCRAGVGPDGST